MITLQEILAQENQIVFVDRSLGQRGDFSWDNYDNNRFEDFDLEQIKIEQQEYEKLRKIMRTGDTTTIPEVAQEIRTFAEIVGNQISYHSKPSSTAYKRRNGNKRTNGRCMSKRARINKEALIQLQETAFSAYQTFRDNETKINDFRYNGILEMVKTLSRMIGLKKDNGYEWGHNARDPNHSDTDERLTAAVFYHSLFDKRTPVLLTADKDFPRLLGIGIRLIGAECFRPDNRIFRKRLKKNRFKLFFYHDWDNYDGRFQQRPLEYGNTFNINGYSPQESEEVRRRFLEIWKHIGSN